MSLIARTYTDIDLNFTKHPVTGDITKKKDISAISASLFNLFNTSNYERLFQPDLGSNLKQALFEPIDGITSALITDLIRNTIGNFEPRVQLEDLVVEPDYDNNGYRIFLTFFMINDPEPVTISLFLERLR
jgi:phage baseplate assembly protein W